GRISENAFALIVKRQIDRRRNLIANCRTPFDLLANAFDGGEITKKTARQILVFANQAEQHVFGFYGPASKLTGFIASEEYDAAGSFRIPFKHSSPQAARGDVSGASRSPRQ